MPGVSANSFEDVAVIVRECGERTSDAVVSLLTDLTGAPVHRVSGRPFARTLRRSLELGRRLGRPWTLCIDADVLALPALGDLIDEARRLPIEIFEVQGLVLDKLLPSRRPAGNHLYRTSLIAHALPLIPSEHVLRPEMETIHAMAARGFRYHQSRQLIGLHDFEQSLGDVYAKAHLHAQKHRQFEGDCLAIWAALADRDPDFEVALRAWRELDPLEARSPVSRDVTDRLLQQRPLRVPDKPALESFDASSVLEWLARATASDPRIDAYRRRIQAGIDAAVFPQTA
jgi:hypothetical protein